MVNDAMRENWAHGAARWVENEKMFDTTLAPVTDAILAAAELGRHRVLDIGCGTGTLLEAAVTSGATATGVDISPAMVDAARQRVPQATVLLGDAQVDELPGPADRVVSRFGVMFFDDPVAAFANIRNACAAGARMVFACWRSGRENPIFTLGTRVLIAALDTPPERPEPGAPGPIAFADRDYLSGILDQAGWSQVHITPFDFECIYGVGDDDGVEDRMGSMLSTMRPEHVAELQNKLGADGWSALLDDARADLRRHVIEGHLRHPGACWLVTAQA